MDKEGALADYANASTIVVKSGAVDQTDVCTISKLFLTWLKIGATSFGGCYYTISDSRKFYL